MKPLVAVFRKEPALLGGLIVAVIAVVVIPLPSAVQASITALGAVISSIAVRAIVWTPASVVDAVNKTAEATTHAVINELAPETVGVVGSVPAVAVEAVKDAVSTVTDLTLKGAGLPTDKAA